MPYCTADDCRLYARHAELATYAFTTEIAHASGEFDALMRGTFEVPLTASDQVVVNIVAKWAAGLALVTKRAVAGNSSEYGEQLISEARAAVREILANPSMISSPLRTSLVDSQPKATVYTNPGTPVFDMRWGE